MTAKIHLRNLKVETIIGFREYERKTIQPLIFEVLVEVDPSELLKTDEIGSTLDYRTLAEFVQSYALASKYHLLERLGIELAHKIAQEFSILSVEVKVSKPMALKDLADVSFEYFFKA